MAEKNSKRNVFIIGGLITLAIGGASVFLGQYFNKEEADTAEIAGVNVQEGVGKVEIVPGESQDENYNKLQEQQNQVEYEKAKEEGNSYIATLTNTSVGEVKKDPLDGIEEQNIQELVIKEPEPEPEIIPEPEPIPEPTPIPEPQPQPIIPPKPPVVKYVVEKPKAKPQVDSSAYEKAYEEEISNLLKTWDASKQAMGAISEFTFEGREKDKEKQGAQVGGEARDGGEKNTESTGGPSFIRKGTMIPAEIIIGVNTDEPGPVQARITSGPLKGAVVMGRVENAPTEVGERVQKVSIVFDSLIVKGAEKTYNIEAYAVDPKTQKPTVASEVNNHYFKRYVVGLAAEFLTGFSDAVANAGKTVVVKENGTTVEQISEDTNKAVKAGLGNAGRKLGAEIEKISNVPATIYVHAGEPIYLLFTADF